MDSWAKGGGVRGGPIRERRFVNAARVHSPSPIPLCTILSQAQRIHMEELLKEMGSRQDQLSAELSSLRQQLGSLLTQRNDLRWL